MFSSGATLALLLRSCCRISSASGSLGGTAVWIISAISSLGFVGWQSPQVESRTQAGSMLAGADRQDLIMIGRKGIMERGWSALVGGDFTTLRPGRVNIVSP